MPYLRFFSGLFILVAVMLPLNYFILREVLGLDFGTLHYVVYFYFIFIVTTIHLVVYNTLSQKPGRFVIAFIGSMAVKILLSLLLLVVIMKWFDNSGAAAVYFLLLYLSFSSFSVYNILKEQGRHKLKQASGEVKKS